MAQEVRLTHPIPMANNKELTSLTMRSYTTAADYLSFDQMGGVQQRIHLVASLCGTEPAVIEKLRGPDYQKLSRMAEDLLIADETALDADEKAEALEKK